MLRSGGLSPRISPKGADSATVRRSRFTSSFSARWASARSSVSISCSISKGLVRKSYAPARMAAIAVSRFPKAVITITGRSGRLAG